MFVVEPVGICLCVSSLSCGMAFILVNVFATVEVLELVCFRCLPVGCCQSACGP